MDRAGALSPADYAALSALFDELSDLAPAMQAERVAALRQDGHPFAERLAAMLAAMHGPSTAELLQRWQRPPRFEAGRRIGPWRRLSPLGSGGMAEVWLARRDDGGLKREVALKLPWPQPGRAGQTRARRFERERDILAALRHPHIAALLDAGVDDSGQAWLALERVDGENICTWCDGQRATLARRVALFRQVLLAVQHAHAQLVIHRDLKPANVRVNAQGEVRLLDFGIAKLLEQGQPMADETALTQQAGRPLTPRYASPDQLRGDALSTASDVYALGVLLHELLTGRSPYRLPHGGAAELERAIVDVEVETPSKALPDAATAAARSTMPRALQRALAPELDAVLLRALAKRPADRYSSVDALLADIDRWAAGVPVPARVPGPWFRLQRFVARHPLGVSLGVLLAAGLIGLSTTAMVFGLEAREQSRRAVLSRDFLLHVFRKADVDQSRGGEISAREMLDWGRRHAGTLPAQPDLRAELLMDIGLSQRGASEPGNGLPLTEFMRILNVQVLAEGLLRSGRPDQALEAVALSRARLSNAAAPMPELALRADLLDGAAHWLANRPQAALERWQAMRDTAFRTLGADSPVAWMYALNMVPALQATGQRAQAQTLVAQGLPVLSAALGADAPHVQRAAGWLRNPAPPSPAKPLDLML